MPRKKVEEKPKRKYTKRDQVALNESQQRMVKQMNPTTTHCCRFETEQWSKLEKLQKQWGLNRSSVLRACVELAWRYRGDVRKI